jgi:hypothetical protein
VVAPTGAGGGAEQVVGWAEQQCRTRRSRPWPWRWPRQKAARSMGLGRKQKFPMGGWPLTHYLFWDISQGGDVYLACS